MKKLFAAIAVLTVTLSACAQWTTNQPDHITQLDTTGQWASKINELMDIHTNDMAVIYYDWQVTNAYWSSWLLTTSNDLSSAILGVYGDLSSSIFATSNQLVSVDSMLLSSIISNDIDIVNLDIKLAATSNQLSLAINDLEQADITITQMIDAVEGTVQYNYTHFDDITDTQTGQILDLYGRVVATSNQLTTATGAVASDLLLASNTLANANVATSNQLTSTITQLANSVVAADIVITQMIGQVEGMVQNNYTHFDDITDAQTGQISDLYGRVVLKQDASNAVTVRTNPEMTGIKIGVPGSGGSFGIVANISTNQAVFTQPLLAAELILTGDVDGNEFNITNVVDVVATNGCTLANSVQLDASGNIPTNVMAEGWNDLLDASYILANEVEWVEEVNGIYVDNIPSASQDKMLFIDIPSVYGNTVLLENFDNETFTAFEYRNDVDGSYPFSYSGSQSTSGKWSRGIYEDPSENNVVYLYKSTWGPWTEATPFRASLWVRPSMYTQSDAFYFLDVKTDAGTYLFRIYSYGARGRDIGVTSQYLAGGSAIITSTGSPQNQWTFLEVSYDPATMHLSLYINGVRKGYTTLTGTWSFAQQTVNNGRDIILISPNNTLCTYDGSVDEVQISLNDIPLTSNYTPPDEPLGLNAPPPRLTQTDFTIDDIQGAIAATNHAVAGAVGATTGFAAGDGAEATSGGAVGEGAYAETSGGAIGYRSDTTTGFAGGDSAASQEGGAVGEGAYAETGGAIGQNAYAESGGAVGASTITTTGFAGGTNAVSITGGAIGQNANGTTGGAVGYNTSTVTGFAGGTSASSARGGAVGESARAVDGFAGGMNAVASVGRAIQLGIGTNSVSSTLKVFEWPLLDSAGHIPYGRLWGLSATNTFYTVDADMVNMVTNVQVYTSGLLQSWTTNGVSL